MPYTVSFLSKLAGVTARTLRYYDRIGLLCPEKRTASGYRLYSDESLERLQQILFFRELCFPLEDIAALLESPRYDRARSLKAQGELLRQKSERYLALAVLAEDALRSMKGESRMDPKKMFESFDAGEMRRHQEKYREEVESRWGGTEAYRISAERTARYSDEDLKRIAAEQERSMAELTVCYESREPAGGDRMRAVCGEARALITRYFYPCTIEIFASLGEMYSADERFAETYNSRAPGLAAYYSEAVRAYCEHELAKETPPA